MSGVLYYDVNENQDGLVYSIPEYIRDDSDNENYDLFINMVGQHFDDIWIYTKDVTQKYNADNRLDYGVSKDLVIMSNSGFFVEPENPSDFVTNAKKLMNNESLCIKMGKNSEIENYWVHYNSYLI